MHSGSPSLQRRPLRPGGEALAGWPSHRPGADGCVQLQLPADAAGLALWQAGVAPEWRPG